MPQTLMDIFRLIIPPSRKIKHNLQLLAPFVSPQDYKYIRWLLRQKKIGVSLKRLDIPSSWTEHQSYPQLHKGVPDDSLDDLLYSLNAQIEEALTKQAYIDFSAKAATVIPKLIAPHLVGLDDVLRAVTWQLLSSDRVHILLLGDPGTGKTAIMEGAATFAPISSYGLGSGASGAGLAALTKGKKVIKGILPLAHKGICCIDELNLLKPRDRGALLNAMEKGFVTYDKGGAHVRLPADVRLLATANPKGERFVGSQVSFIKDQLPIDPALLSRFNMIFIFRKPTSAELAKITRSVMNQERRPLKQSEIAFIKGYVSFAGGHSVRFQKSLEPVITDLMQDLEYHEEDYLIEVSPRTALGVVRLAKAAARLSLRDEVSPADLGEVIRVLKKSLYVPPDPKRRKV